MTSPAPIQAPERRPFRRRIPILYVLLGVLVTIGLAPLCSIAWKLIEINREALMTAEQQKQLLLAKALGREIDIQVELLEAQVSRAAQSLGGARRADSIDGEALREALAATTDPRIVGLRFAFFSHEGVNTVDAGAIPAGLEPALDAGLRAAAELAATGGGDGQHAVRASSPLRASEEAGAVVALSAPVLARGSFHGVLTALVDLQAIWDDVHTLHRTGNVLFALDGAGRVFASNDSRRVPPGEDASSSPLVQRFLEGGGAETMPFVLRRDAEDRPHIGSYYRTAQGWGIFVQAEEREVYEIVRQMKWQTMTWALVVMVLAIGLAFVLARNLSRPIRRLATASSAFAAGDFAARADVRSTNEIGELAHTFNGMADDIERYIRDKEELFRGTIQAISQAIDNKDPYTQGHSARVNRYAVILAQDLGLSEGEIRTIDVASMLHDVGKIGIKDQILGKEGPLTAEEFEEMKTHTTRGAAILAPIPQMRGMIPGLRSHHERWLGNGYPDGLAGEQIPLMARIIAVADTFDAITTNRPYQRCMTFEQALARLEELRGQALDTRIVDVFLRACREGRIRLAASASPAATVALAG